MSCRWCCGCVLLREAAQAGEGIRDKRGGPVVEEIGKGKGRERGKIAEVGGSLKIKRIRK